MILVTSYSATLVSFLTVVDDGLEFQDIEQMVKLDKYRLGILGGARIEEYFKVIFYLLLFLTRYEISSNKSFLIF